MSTYDIETAIERRRRQWDAYTERQRAKQIKQAGYHLESLIAARKFLASGDMKPVFVPEDPEELAALRQAQGPAAEAIDEPVVVEPTPAPVEPPVEPKPVIVKPPPLCQRILDALKTVPSANVADLAELVGEPTIGRLQFAQARFPLVLRTSHQRFELAAYALPTHRQVSLPRRARKRARAARQPRSTDDSETPSTSAISARYSSQLLVKKPPSLLLSE